MSWKVPFDMQAVHDGYWEIYHDDDCGELVIDRHCTKCGFFVDLQSLGARPTPKNERIAESSTQSE